MGALILNKMKDETEGRTQVLKRDYSGLLRYYREEATQWWFAVGVACELIRKNCSKGMVFVQWHQDDLAIYHIEPDHQEWDGYQNNPNKPKVKFQAPNEDEETDAPDPPEMRIQEEGGAQSLKDKHLLMRKRAEEQEAEHRRVEKLTRIIDSADDNPGWMEAAKEEMNDLQETTIFGAHAANTYNAMYEHEYIEPKPKYVGSGVDKHNSRKIANLIMHGTTPKLGFDITHGYIHARLGAQGTTVHRPKHKETQNSKKRKTASTNTKLQKKARETKERNLYHTKSRAQEEPNPTIGKEEQTRHTHHYHTRGRKDMCLEKQS